MEGTWALPEHSTTQKFVPIGALAGMSRVLFFGRSIFSFQTGLLLMLASLVACSCWHTTITSDNNVLCAKMTTCFTIIRFDG